VRHLLTTTVVAVAFVGMLWFGVVVLGLSPGETTVASLLTLSIVGIGLMLTRAGSRNPQDDQ
jgi:hypothetical protein